MFVAKLSVDGEPRVGVAVDGVVHVAHPSLSLDDVLSHGTPTQVCETIVGNAKTTIPVADADLLAPVGHQEIWAAGVTYTRSRQARMAESPQAANHYDRVYEATRPELFFKATARRVVGPGRPVRIRSDSRWSVPEPELALIISPSIRLVGFTIGNDMSARDIEGENPLYLPQAKIYRGSVALGPWIVPVELAPQIGAAGIGLTIERNGRVAFEGRTTLSQLRRTFDELIYWLGRENDFPDGVILLTGTGIVPPDDFSLAGGDKVTIEIEGIGKLVNPVE